MTEETLKLPSGSGGLTNYNVSYNSKLSMSPYFVLFLIVTTIISMAAIKIVFKI